MTNIKIVRRFAKGQYKEGTETEVYDIYFDVGFFSPLIKKVENCQIGTNKRRSQ